MEEHLIQQVRKQLARQVDIDTNVAPIDVQDIATDLNTSVPRVNRALRDLERKKNEIRRHFGPDHKPFKANILPKFYENTVENMRNTINDHPKENSYDIRYAENRNTYSDTNYVVRPMLPKYSKNIFAVSDPVSEESNFPAVLSACPTIYAYGRLLSDRSENPMPFVENVAVIHSQAKPLVTESLRMFNAVSYVSGLLTPDQRQMMLDILKGKRVEHNHFSKEIVSD